jgi:predicted GH43/DUF377 family glycosyl hydrolase
MIGNRKPQFSGVITGILFLLLSLAAPAGRAQTNWQKYDLNPVLVLTEPWDHLVAIGEPTCILENGAFRMWLTGAHDEQRYQIYHAASADGITWFKEPAAVLSWGTPGEWDHWTLDTAEVIRDDEGYKLYYFAQPEPMTPPFNAAIGMARSDDGINWEKEGQNPLLLSGGVGDWDEYWVESPTVVYDGAGGTYEMWYSGVGGDGFQIGYAESDNGRDWQKHPLPVLSPGQTGSWDDQVVAVPTVIKRDGLYEMWYGGTFDDGSGDINWSGIRIGYATSSNGIDWDKHGENPVLSREDPPADIAVPWAPDVLFDHQQSRLLLWYATDFVFCLAGDPAPPEPVHDLLLAGPGPGIDNPPVVRTFPLVQEGAHLLEFRAYGAAHYGVNVSCGRVNGGTADVILTGAGPGDIYGPHVRGFLPDGTPVAGLSFLAYGTNRFGVNVAAGDLDGDGYDEIITGAGPGDVFGPHVRAFDFDGGPPVSPVPGVSYFAYGTLKYGVNVTAGDLDGDGYDEIVTGAGPGDVFGPHVRGWNVDGGTAAAIPGISFFAYGTLKYGVDVAAGDLDGDGLAEIITAPGPSGLFGAHIRGWNVDGSVSPMPGFSFFAWPADQSTYGARIFAGSDLDGDGRDDLVTGAGPDPQAGTPVSVYRYLDGTASLWFSLEAFPAGTTMGASVAGGRLS